MDDFEADFDVITDGYYTDRFWAAFAFRKTNYSDWYGTSGYMVYYRYNGWIELHSAAGGVLATSNTGNTLSTWRHVKIVANGTSIKVYSDGVLRINATDGTYTKGYFGLNVFGVAARYDNLTVNGNPFKDEVYYVRDVDGEVLAEYDGAGNLLAEYVSANGQRIAKINPAGNVDLYLNDHLGSARAMVGTGWNANYYPYGEVASQAGADDATRYDFTGKERDRATNLMYFGARYYDPEIGRWVSVDPLAELSPERSPYNYTRNNPVNFIDPSGLKEFTDEECRNGATLGEGDWCYSDRINNTDKWQNANLHNLGRRRGFEEYADPSQRAAFYQWFFQVAYDKGHRVYWPAGAAFVASQIAFMWENAGLMLGIGSQYGITRDLTSGMLGFGAAANEEIFNNVFGRLADLYFGSATLTGNAATDWDRATLRQEQKLVQGLYNDAPVGVVFVLELFAKNPSLVRSMPYPLKEVPFSGNIGVPEDRIAYGMRLGATLSRNRDTMLKALLKLNSNDFRIDF